MELIESKSHGRITVLEETANLPQTAARGSYRLDTVVAKPITLSTNNSFHCIRAFEKELKAIEQTV